MKNVARSMENLTAQLEGESSEDLFIHELLGLDKQLRSSRGSLKVEVAKKVQLEERIKKENCKLKEIRGNPEYDDGIQEDIRKRIAKLSDNLSVRQESIYLLKGRLKDKITSLKETIAKVLDKDTSLTERIWMLFQEQKLQSLPYSQPLEWLLVFWLKHCFLVVVGMMAQPVSLHLGTRKG